jgi:multiple sugar transport system permease protein
VTQVPVEPALANPVVRGSQPRGPTALRSAIKTGPASSSSLTADRALLRIAKWGCIAVAVTVAVFPLYWMLRTSLAGSTSVFQSGISILPKQLAFSNFTEAWKQAALGKAMLNGAIVTMAILICQLLTCIPAAYAFAKLRFRGRMLLYGIVLACLLVPEPATAIPLYIGIAKFHLANTRTGLILPFVTSAFGIFLIRQYMVTIPDSVLEAARMDGLNSFKILRRIVIPLSMPAIATFAIFSVFVHWNDYLWPLLIARSPGIATPPLALANFNNPALGVNYALLAAAAVIITAPIVVLFAFAQRQFVAGIAGTEI